eukprot:1202509-Pyramimonas_sp.AAC.1
MGWKKRKSAGGNQRAGVGQPKRETRAMRKGEPGCKGTSASGCKRGRSFDRTTRTSGASVCRAWYRWHIVRGKTT